MDNYDQKMPLSEEQRKKIEENRQRALAKRKNVSCVPISEKLCAVDTINKNTLSQPGPGVSWASAKQNQQPSTIPLRATPNCATSNPSNIVEQLNSHIPFGWHCQIYLSGLKCHK